MSNTVAFESREQKLNKDIEEQVGKLGAASPLTLPAADAEVSKLYVRKIEGTYNVERAKKDTDNAIDLLYIAYNTTPQAHGEIRVTIGAIMDKLIKAQQESELTMRRAMGVAKNLLDLLKNTFPDWQDLRNCKGPEDTKGVAEIKDFVKNDLLEVAKKIKDQALAVKAQLDGIATTYQGIITDTAGAASKSETALASELKNKEALEKEINESNAKREQLEELVKDLQEEVEKYDKMARDYESRASTAEERAFVMSIVQIGAQMVASAVPGIVTAATGAATGGVSVVAAAAANTVSRAVGDKNSDVKKSDTATDDEVVQTKTKISEKKGQVLKAEKLVTDAKDKVKGLETDLAGEEKKEGKGAGAGAGAGKTEEKKEDSEAVKALKTRVADAKSDLKKEEDKYNELIGALSGLQAALTALDKGLGKLTEKQENAAAGLRELQMKMLDKVEAYEKERRTQNAELVKINALLKGKRSQEETIHLAIQSLNISISALKRTKEIVQEIAFFFKSFADFMDQVSTEAGSDVALFDTFVGRATVRENYFKNLVSGIDNFFLRVYAEWHAITFVSDKFCKSFADGWSKLNKLSGKYIHGDELETYLKGASQKIEEIVAEREEAAKQKILDLDGYRKQLRDSAMA
jgi:predicted  nucleic acid-binding Zn-ribbon protein